MYKTKFWESGCKWNGVIFPIEESEVKQQKRKHDVSDIIINVADKGDCEDDIRCSIGDKVSACRAAMTQAISDIDKIRAVDVPIKTYITLYIVFMLFTFALAYIMTGVMRLYIALSIVLIIFLILGNTFAFGLITYIGFKEEESADAKKLACLYNQIKQERGNQLNYIRMDLKLKALDKSRT